MNNGLAAVVEALTTGADENDIPNQEALDLAQAVLRVIASPGRLSQPKKRPPLDKPQVEPSPAGGTKSLDKPHKYGCLMTAFSDDFRKEVTDWTLETIPDFHLGPGGREDRPHITVKYGFKNSDLETISNLRAMLIRNGPITVTLEKELSLFGEGYGKWNNEDGDVLKVGIFSPELHQLNAIISASFPCEDKYPEYKPHMTLAYLDPIISKSYVGLTPSFLGRQIRVDTLVFTGPDGVNETIHLSFLPGLNGTKSLEEDPLKKVQEIIDSCTEEELDGINVWFNTDKPHVVIIDIMDWGSEDVGKKIGKHAIKVVGDQHVIYHNEQGKPQGDSWTEVKPSRKKKALSAMNNSTGGALVAPPAWMGPKPLIRKTPYQGRKILSSSRIKSGFSGRIQDSLGRDRCYQNGSQIACGQAVPGSPGQRANTQPAPTQQAAPKQEVAPPVKIGQGNEEPTRKVGEGNTGPTPHVGIDPSESLQKKLLRTTAVKGMKPLDQGGAGRAKMLFTLKDGRKAVFKPSLGEEDMRKSIPTGTHYLREAAASSVADVLGFGDMVPPTVVRKEDDSVGSIQEFVNYAESAFRVAADEGDEASFDGGEEAARAAIFDYIIGQTDRHHGNWLLKDGKIVLIDNGLAFPTKRDLGDFIDVEFWRYATENNLSMPDVTDMKGKWDALERSLRSIGIEQEAINLTKERFDAVTSGEYHKVSELPNPLRPSNKGMTLGQVTNMIVRLSSERRGV